jgi:FkbM family methyltransferase
LNVEPVPSLAAALREQRPRDATIAAAAGAGAGLAQLFAAETTGNSTMIPDLAREAAAGGLVMTELTVPVAPLDELLEQADMADRTIHFCSIDVEGFEAEVLEGFDLVRWRPWILVVEATRPNSPEPAYEEWEPRVLKAGYQFCLFDGLNRFYLHEDHSELAGTLSYPACVFDEAFERAVDAGRQITDVQLRAAEVTAERDRLSGHLVRLDEEVRQLASALAEAHGELVRWREQAHQNEKAAAEFAGLEHENAHLRETAAKLAAIESTVSWRITKPLRSVRRVQLRSTRAQPPTTSASPARRETAVEMSDLSPELRAAFARRLLQASATLLPGSADTVEELDPAAARRLLEKALAGSTAPIRAKAWLALVAADGAYPEKLTVDRAARRLRMEGPSGVGDEVVRRFGEAVTTGRRSTAGLQVVDHGVVVDVSHTISHDLHTGIQRVVRETVSRWIDADRPVSLVHFDAGAMCPRLLSEGEAKRIQSWREHLSSSGSHIAQRAPKEESGDVLVPWRSHLILPELVAEPHRCESYRALASAGVLDSLALIGYDLIPMTAAETVTDGMTANFGQYLAMVKHADRVAAISRATARDFEAFTEMAASQGLSGPEVVPFELPTEVPELSGEQLERARTTLGVGTAPVVLVVGSHEPRKNHLAVLEAAERIWEQGEEFDLLMIGGSGWKSEEFDEVVEQLVAAGRSVNVRKRSTETELWAAYRLARFSVFPSLLEGFGLPVAESLATGTPVITSNFGSMAEIAERGGCVVVDPLDVDEIERAMSSLLTDDDELHRLRNEVAFLPRRTWEVYADQVWRYFVEGDSR